MAVWGIGAYAKEKNCDLSEECLKNNCAIIRFEEGTHEKEYNMFRTIKPGDIVFLKARYIYNRPMKVKAIGIAFDTNLCVENGTDGNPGIKVLWLKNLIKDPYIVEKDRHNDGSAFTIYEETNPQIIREILEQLK